MDGNPNTTLIKRAREAGRLVQVQSRIERGEANVLLDHFATCTLDGCEVCQPGRREQSEILAYVSCPCGWKMYGRELDVSLDAALREHQLAGCV